MAKRRDRTPTTAPSARFTTISRQCHRTYKSAGKWFLRLACFQHVKRKFLDCGEDFDCKVIVRLMNIFKRGDYHLDNNDIERLNRYISLSRRNSLFFGSHKGAERGAMFYSLVCLCRLNGVNFFEYISDVINKAAALPPNTPLEKYRMLLPDKWKENR